MPDPEVPGRRRRSGPSWRPSRWSLRTRLITALVGLLAVVLAAVGIGTGLALHGFLVGRLDSQLTAAGGRSATANGDQSKDQQPPQRLPGNDGGQEGAAFLLAPGQEVGTLGARIVGGRVTAAGVLTDDGTLQPLSVRDTATLTGLRVDDDGPRTLSVPGRGDYRVLATRTPDGDVLVTGLPLAPVNATMVRLVVVETAIAGGALIIAAAAGAGIVRRSLRPLRRVAATATRVSSRTMERGEVSLPERVPVADTDGRTEVGQVGAALNRLLDRVSDALTARQASESRVRQFVADASHELRTPLAAIRGYAELTRRSRPAAPPDLAHAMARVESEADRMSELVDELLLLARLDSGRPLASGPVDLSAMVVDAVSDAAAAGPDHRWDLQLPDRPVVVPGDDARLRQVVANLLANARAHTPPGTAVTTSLAAGPPGRVRLSVRDNGPGIPADLQANVFERFARGDTARSHRPGQPGGTGLGLAIVSAIVSAHGGTVQVASEPGHTVFEVVLPAGPDDGPGPPDPAAAASQRAPGNAPSDGGDQDIRAATDDGRPVAGRRR